MLAVARTLVARDLLLAWRRRADAAVALLFFIIVASLFPLGIGAEPNQLRAIAPGVIWVAALLSSLLSLGRLFAADHADGTLEQLMLGAAPLGVVAAAKTVAHWLVSGLPLVVIAPVIALQYDVERSLYGVLALSLLLGTPVLSFIGAIGAALARLLVSQSVPLWLLDEPFAALDARGAAALEDLLAGQLRAGGTVVYTTHQPSALDAAARLIELG